MTPSISEIKYLGNGNQDILEVRVPESYPDPQNLRLVIYDRTHNGSTTASPSAGDIHNVTSDGLLYTEDTDNDGQDDDGILHYTFGSTENGTNIFLHAEDAVGLYNVVTGETYGLYSWGNAPYTASTATGDPFAGQTATLLDNTGQVRGVTSLEQLPNGDYVLNTTPDPGESYVCFVAGTRILTPHGFRAVESLQAGDLVITKDKGPKPVRWAGHARFMGLGADHLRLQPVRIRAHAFGQNVPERDICVSPNHALLIDHWRTSLYFGDDEVLTPAKALLGDGSVRISPRPDVSYHHLLLDEHSLINAEGLWSESLYLGMQGLGTLSQASRAEIFDIFPELAGHPDRYGDRARQQIKVHDAGLVMPSAV